MVVRRCPHCKSNYSADKFDVDYVHGCNSGNSTLDNEDKLDLTSLSLRGVANKLKGRPANIENGATLHSITSRGNHTDTHVTRARSVHIDIKNNTWSENPSR